MRKKNKKRVTRRKKKKALPFKKPNTARQYFLLSPRDQETWDNIGHFVSRMREKITFPKALKEFGLARNTVIGLARPALRKRNGRYVATKTDALLRVIFILSAGGKKQIATRDSRQASIVGGHWAAVQRYLQTGDNSALHRFKGKKVVDASGKRHRLLTNLEELNRLASAGVLSFESMYAGGLR